MQASCTFKRAFLQLMLEGLNGVHYKSMSFQERKNVIKLSANAAMAIARGGRTVWSRALISDILKHEQPIEKKSSAIGKYSTAIPTAKKILRRRRLRSSSRRNCKSVAASVLARRMMKKRSQLLKKVIPGGESLNRLSLLSETVDYVIHLQAQVNLMQCLLARALGAPSLKCHGSINSEKATHCRFVDGTYSAHQIHASRASQPQEEGSCSSSSRSKLEPI